MLTRAEILLAPVPRGGRILELGPSFNPIAPKADGWNSFSIDHLTREGLVAKYKGHPGVDLSRIEPVDFVWTSGSLSAAVPSEQHGSFDAFLASHVIEHTPDLIAFLDAAGTLLKPDGLVVLAIPDKRYCFDYFQPLTTTGQLLEAHAHRRSRHTPRLAFDYFAYTVSNGNAIAWAQHPSQEVRFVYGLEGAGRLFRTIDSDPDYVDLHAWRFVPSSFELLMLELARLGETDWRVERITPTEGCEFHVWLRRGGGAFAASLSVEELDARRMELLKRTLVETLSQIEWLLMSEPELGTGLSGSKMEAAMVPAALVKNQAAAPEECLAEVRDRQAALEACLAEVRNREAALQARLIALENSTSWRLTAPIRVLKHRTAAAKSALAAILGSSKRS